MISYHPQSLKLPVGTTFTYGFKSAEVATATQYAKCMTSYAWSNCTWEGGYRNKKSFIGASWFALDFDSPEMSLEQAKRTFCDTIHVIGTTRSHQKEKDGVKCDRFRVVIKASRIMREANEYEFNIRKMNRWYPSDPACVDAARHYFKCQEIVQVNDEGETQDVLDYEEDESQQDKERRLRQTRAAYRVFGQLPDWVDEVLENGFAENQHSTAMRIAYIMFEHGISGEEVLGRICAAPIRRPWQLNEVGNLVKHADQNVNGN